MKVQRLAEKNRFVGSNALAPPVRVSVYPYPATVTRWYAVIETQNAFVTSDVNSLSGKLNQSELMTIPKPPETPAMLAAKHAATTAATACAQL